MDEQAAESQQMSHTLASDQIILIRVEYEIFNSEL